MASTSSRSPEYEQFLREFETEHNADLEIHVSGRIFRVIKSFLFIKSSVFRAMFQHETREKETSSIKIENDNPDLVRRFLLYFYINEIEDLKRDVTKMFGLAEYYDVETLRERCLKTMSSNMNFANVREYFELANKFNLDKLKQECIDFVIKNVNLDTFFQFLEFANKNESKIVLANVVDFIVKNAKEVIIHKDWEKLSVNFRLNMLQMFVGETEIVKRDLFLTCRYLEDQSSEGPTDVHGIRIRCFRKTFTLSNWGKTRVAFKICPDYFANRENHYFCSHPKSSFLKLGNQIEIRVIHRSLNNFIILYETSNETDIRCCFKSNSFIRQLKIDL